MAGDTDRQLIVRVRARDREAFETFYDRHCEHVMGIAIQVLVDRERLEAIVLDAFWWLWKNSFLVRDAEGAFITWLYPIVQHMAISERNRQIAASEPDAANEFTKATG